MESLLSDLNREQRQAVTHKGAPLLVLAGAGSGKTKVLTYRAFYLIQKKLADPSEIILLTFTNKAAEEMKTRVAKMSDGPSGILGTNSRWELGFAGTFHTFGARMLRHYGQLVNLPPNFVIYDTDDSESVIKGVIKGLGLDPKNNRPGMYRHLISRMKNELLTPADLAETAKDDFYKKVVSVFLEYEKVLRKAAAVDFDDLLIFTVRLLSLAAMQERIGEKYKYILVDEYQDTNKAQFLLTKLLAVHPTGLMVVGDAAQAIYSFRGADFRNLSLLEKEYPDLVTLRLPKNYRSTQTILDAAYGVIANNKNHPVLKLTAIKSFGEKIDMVEVIDEKEEAAYVVSVAERLSTVGGSLAVLYRTNAQSRAIEEALIRRKIDYKLVGGTRFYDRAEIKDLLAYLRVIYNSEDLVSWQRIEGLGKRNKAKFEIWLASERGRLLEKYPHELLQEIIDQTGYLSRFNERDEEDAARVENIKELLAVASEHPSLTGFLESVALIQSEEIAERKDQLRQGYAGQAGTSVTMMTIHAAKGLEFDEVIIVGLEEGLLPHSRSLLEREDLEEERRLMYVAMTRARAKLHLTLTRSRLVYGGRQAASPSRFLAEIPQELLKIASRGLSYRELTPKTITNDDFVEERRIVSDWETEPTSLKLRWPSGMMVGRADPKVVEEETKNDFDEIDAW